MHERRRPNWKDTPIAAWIGEGFRYLNETLKIDETTYRKTLRKRLFGTMTLAYWQALVDHADLHDSVPKKTEDELAEQAIARHLGLHRAQPGRWLKGEIFPDGDKVFAALVVVLQKEIEEVGFPKNRDVAWQAVSRTLWHIRTEDCGLKGQVPGRKELACVWWLVRHPQSDLFLGAQRPISKGEVYLAVLDELRHVPKGPQGPKQPQERDISRAEDVEQALDRWLIPYVLFRVGLLEGWEHLDDEAF